MDLSGILSSMGSSIGSNMGTIGANFGNAINGVGGQLGKMGGMIATNMKNYPEWAKKHPVYNSLLKAGAGSLGGAITGQIVDGSPGLGALSGAAGAIGYPMYQDMQKKQEEQQKLEEAAKWNKLMTMMQGQGGIIPQVPNQTATESLLPPFTGLLAHKDY